MKLHFPHITRIFSAPFQLPWVRQAQTAVLWMGFVGLVGINAYMKATASPSYWPMVVNVLTEPRMATPHVALAQAYWQGRYWEGAKRELLLAEEFSQEAQHADQKGVLGAVTSPRDLLNAWEQEPRRLNTQYLFWQQVTKDKPGYRDAYLMTAVLAYQLGKMEEAKDVASKAFHLSPTSPYAHDLLTVISQVTE